MSRWDPGLSEPDRHAVAVAMDPQRFAVPDYIRALADPSWRVRKAALRHVRHYSSDPAFVDSLVLSLSSEENAGLRNAASEALVQLGAAAVSSLANSLAEGSVDVRKFVVEALGLIGGDGAERALYTALEDTDLNVRAAAAEAL
ncbi:MAG: HEAT repeat domain-containing protein, partial [Myxococcota bacterium]